MAPQPQPTIRYDGANAHSMNIAQQRASARACARMKERAPESERSTKTPPLDERPSLLDLHTAESSLLLPRFSVPLPVSLSHCPTLALRSACVCDRSERERRAAAPPKKSRNHENPRRRCESMHKPNGRVSSLTRRHSLARDLHDIAHSLTRSLAQSIAARSLQHLASFVGG